MWVLEAGIKGVIHTVRLLFQQHAHEKYMWFCLIDAHNALNEENRTAMLWAVRHKWTSGARFEFN